MVNASGKVAKNTTVKNADGVKYKTSSSGSLTKVDDEDAPEATGIRLNRFGKNKNFKKNDREAGLEPKGWL